MRISEFLRASFVGALLFSPAMADEVEQVHAEALRVLREQLGQSGAAAPAFRLDQADPETARTRAEREARIKAEAEQRMADRDKLQAERRLQFEQFVKERERLRQEQREYDVNAARQAGLVRDGTENDVHARALEVLRQEGQQQTIPAAAPTTGLASAPASAAPQVVAQAPSALSSSTQSDNADVHAKALEVLRQQLQSAQSPVAGGPTAAPQPSPELQRRLKEMQTELEQEQVQKRTGTVRSSMPEGYVTELEKRALESVQGSSVGATTVTAPSVTPAPAGLDPATREMIERQNREIARGLGTTTPSAARPATTAPQTTPAPAPTIVPESTVTHTTVTDSGNVQYSKELEERARQILLERAGQNVQTTQPTTTVTAHPAPAVTAPSVSATTTLPAATTPPSEAVNAATSAANNSSPAATRTPDVHAQALETLNQIQSGGSNLPRTKMQRLKDLTDLYRADKIGPAEYHQKRAQILAEPQ